MDPLSIAAIGLGILVCLSDGLAVKSKLVSAERVWESDGLRTSFIPGKGLFTKIESRWLVYPQMPEVVQAHQKKVINGISSTPLQLLPPWLLMLPAVLYAPEACEKEQGVLLVGLGLLSSLLIRLAIRRAVDYFLRKRLRLLFAR